MTDQSHKEDMRAALRGDFERLKQRRSKDAERERAHAPRAGHERIVLTPARPSSGRPARDPRPGGPPEPMPAVGEPPAAPVRGSRRRSFLGALRRRG